MAASRPQEPALEALRELHALVCGECPSLLNEDSGGDARLAMKIESLLEHADLRQRWAAQREDAGGKPEKIAEARDCADAMEAWKEGRQPVPQATPGAHERLQDIRDLIERVRVECSQHRDVTYSLGAIYALDTLKQRLVTKEPT